MTFSLHYSIKYFKNNNCSLKYFESFFPVNASFSERFAEKCSTFHSNDGHYKEDSNVQIISFSEVLVTRDVDRL